MQHCKCIVEDTNKLFDIFMVMCLMTLFFCVMTTRLWVSGYRRFERTYCLHLEESRDPIFYRSEILLVSQTPKWRRRFVPRGAVSHRNGVMNLIALNCEVLLVCVLMWEYLRRTQEQCWSTNYVYCRAKFLNVLYKKNICYLPVPTGRLWTTDFVLM